MGDITAAIGETIIAMDMGTLQMEMDRLPKKRMAMRNKFPEIESRFLRDEKYGPRFGISLRRAYFTSIKMSNMNFAITGVAGYIAPRHLRAIRDTGNRLLAATDPHDSVGILDQYSFDVRYFPEIERFDRYVDRLRRGPEENRIHYMTICSPNYLHDAHIRLALRLGANAICEKPLVINPWNLDALEELEHETGKRVYTILQLRVHPALIELKKRVEQGLNGKKHDVVLTYITSRGPWYDVSWKGNTERSGGIAVNIGIHLFDLLIWLFGEVGECHVHLREPKRIAGYLRT